MIAALDNSEDHIRAIIFEAWYAGGFNNPVISAMLTQANAEGGAQVVVREGLHQVEHQGEHGDGFNLHIGTLYNANNFHLNVHQNARGRLYVSSITLETTTTARDRLGRTNRRADGASCVSRLRSVPACHSGHVVAGDLDPGKITGLAA
jgi:hypothetical protein